MIKFNDFFKDICCMSDMYCQTLCFSDGNLCLTDIIYCEPNKEFGTAQKAGMWSNPLWGMEQLPKVRFTYPSILLHPSSNYTEK